MKKTTFFLIGAILCIYGINDYLDMIICIVLTIFLIINIKKDEFDYIFFGLMFFEPILQLPFISNASFFRIYQILFIIKIIIDIKEKHFKIKWKNILTILAGLLIITGSLYLNILSYISLVFNTIIVYYFMCKEYKSQDYYENLLYTVGIFIVFSAIYGFFRGNTLNFGGFKRKSTTINDPNYSALFLDIGIFSIIGNNQINKKEKIIETSILIISLTLTVSLTGIMLCIAMMLLYIYMKNKELCAKITIFSILTLIIFINIPIPKDNTIYGIQKRLSFLKDNTTMNDISSGRTNILSKYIENFFKLPIKNIILGGKNTIDGAYRDKMVKEIGNISHNSYIDMMYMMGMPLTIIIMIITIYNTLLQYKSYKNNKAISLNYFIIKIILIIFAFTLSLFPYRYYISIIILTSYLKNFKMIKYKKGKHSK